tara:strand:+ start:157 stop:753 length:597 start_codon:yes stop_codon:yes gene_type:complete
MKIKVLKDPFPHVIIENVYEEDELELIWDELKFFTRPGKLLPPEEYGAAVGKTEASAIVLDRVFSNNIHSNIISLETRILNTNAVQKLSQVHESCRYFCNDIKLTTKLRYYHDGESYDTHADYIYSYVFFTYFNKTPKKYEGGELIFPDHDYSFPCDNNTTILIPGYIPHGVNEVSIRDSDYYDGYGRYCVTMFATLK